MGQIVGAFATSHAFTFMEPAGWPEVVGRNRALFEKRHGRPAPFHARIASETPQDIQTRFERIRKAHDALRAQIIESKANMLIVIGDDQNEHLTSRNVPQIAVYTGGDFALSSRWSKQGASYKSQQEFARALHTQGVDHDFDLASLGSFEDDQLDSHAHAQVLGALMPNADIPVVLVFLNAVHVPATTPSRCYQFGKLLAKVVNDYPEDARVLICASGGLSHFTAGYPYKHYQGPFDYGDISEAFDHQVIKAIESGHGETLAKMTSTDLIGHGEIELRAWIALLGAMGPVRSRFMVYEPFYSAIMAMGVASWPAVA